MPSIPEITSPLPPISTVIEKPDSSSTNKAKSILRSDLSRSRSDHPTTLPTNWLNFWIYIRLPLGALLQPLIFFTEEGSGAVAQDTTLVALTLMIFGSIGAFAVTVAVGLHYRRLWAWKANWLLLFGEWPLMPAVSEVEIPDVLVYLIGYLGALIFIGLVWVWPNYVYFRKRRVLFA